ncbi:MAG: hypothetical protein J0I12_12550 [Candidatus Eremiobacteraeota bacterium]|nr:hypothetical protein [Candidatus Eremiobacteraeota bacterium]
MKRFLILLLLVAQAALAEEPPKDQLTELYSKLGAVSPKVVKAGYTILHVEFDRLAPGGEYSLRRDLSAKNKYKVVGVGAKGITDLQVRVIDPKGQGETNDRQVDSVAIINMVPKTSGLYTIKVGAGKINADHPYFFCLIASKPK